MASSRKWSAGTSRGYLAFIAKDYRDDTYYWCVLVSFKDLLFIASAAFFRSGVEQLVFCDTLSLASSRKWSAGTSRGYLAFFAEDLPTIACAAFFLSGVEQLVFLRHSLSLVSVHLRCGCGFAVRRAIR